jgi:hypothetical protein
MNATRRSFESLIGDYAKQWRAGSQVEREDGSHTIDYFLQPRKKVQPDEVLAVLMTAGGTDIIDAEIR